MATKKFVGELNRWRGVAVESSVSPSELHVENAKLREQIAEQHAMIADRDAKMQKLAGDVAALEAAVKHLLASRRAGLRIPEGQGLLFPNAVITAEPANAEDEANDLADEEGEEDVRGTAEQSRRARTPRKIDTAGLPHEDQIHELPQDQRVCPITAKPLVPVGEKVFEELDYKRARLIVIRHRQVIYGLPPAEAEQHKAVPVAAELPPRPLENCAASATLLAWLLVQKYGNHLPLYRQEQIFGRDGLRLPRQTLCDWADRKSVV